MILAGYGRGARLEGDAVIAGRAAAPIQRITI